VDLAMAAPSHLLSAGVGTAVAVVTGVAYARARPELLHGVLLPVLAGSAVALAGFVALQWPLVGDGGRRASALCLVLVAAVTLVLARWVAREEISRRTVEVIAVLSGIAATTIPADLIDVALDLTILGSAVALVAILNHDREYASWLGVLLLGAATLIRVTEEVTTPEAYALPAAALLLAAGWWRLGHDRQVSSVRALSSGLSLGLVPSLLLALDEPVSLRGVLVGVAALTSVVIGVARLWAAPLVAGAGAGALLALRHLGPVVDAVPRWISLGSVGLALLLVGITWEGRRHDLQAARRYLVALR